MHNKINNILRIPLALIGFLCFSPILFAQKNDTLIIDTEGEYLINKHLYIYKTARKVTPPFVYASIEKSNFIRLFPKSSYNNSTSTLPYYWLMLTIKNNLPDGERFYFWLNSPGIGVAKAYQMKIPNEFEYIGSSGFFVPLTERQNKGYDVEFSFYLEAGQGATILILVDNSFGTNAFFVPKLSDANYFFAQKKYYHTVIGIISGIMIIALLLNIFLGISLRANIHYLYASYILCLLCEIFTLEGIANAYLITISPHLSDLVARVLPSLCLIQMTLIMQWFLNQKRSNSNLVPAVNTGVIILGLLAVINTVSAIMRFGPQVTNKLQMALAVCLGIQLMLIILSAIEKAIQRQKLAMVYLAATFWLLVGVFEYILVFLGFDVTDQIIRQPNNMQIGLVVEVVVVFMAIIYRYNLYKKEKEKLLIERTLQQQKVFNMIVSAEEDERSRIAADLHDDIGATLSTLNLHISNPPTDSVFKQDMEIYHSKSLALSSKASRDIRDIAHNLLPKDFQQHGLFSILKNRVDDLNFMGKIQFSIVLEGSEALLNNEVSITIYRILNELMSNIITHSKAATASIQLLIEPGFVQIMAEDDGVGFDINKEANGIGLKNIRNRVQLLNGVITIDSSSNGTHTIINIPL